MFGLLSKEKEALPGAGLGEWLAQLTLGEPRRAGDLEVTPLRSSLNGHRPWLLFSEAMEKNLMEVEEKRGGGTVSEVTAFNKGKDPVLIIEGETIVGAKQNRTVVATVLVAPNTMVNLSVGCMERGRWFGSMGFAAGSMTMLPRLRKPTQKEFAARGRVDQARLWADVHQEMAQYKVASPSSDYHRIVESREADVKKRALAFEVERGQVGMVATYGGELMGMEVVGHPDAWPVLRERVLSSYLMQAEVADARSVADVPGTKREKHTATEWFALLGKSRMTPGPTRGLGIRFTVVGDGFDGSTLWYEDRAAHLAVFG